MSKLSRRRFLAGVPAAAGALGLAGAALTPSGPARAEARPGNLKVGLVTYLLAHQWDLPTLIANCAEAKFEGVELRTTHAHGVEVTLTTPQRAEVRRRFEDSPVRLASLGSAFEYHAIDPVELERNIEGSRQYAQLAADLGCPAIKVRPNGLNEDQGVSREQTIAQIARALDQVGAAAGGLGVEVRVEVHGAETSRIPVYHAIMRQVTSPNVFTCWNCNENDLADEGFEANFAKLAKGIRFVHMRDLYVEDYPWRRLFELLNQSGYQGYCCAEIPESADPVRLMKYYRALFLAYQDRL